MTDVIIFWEKKSRSQNRLKLGEWHRIVMIRQSKIGMLQMDDEYVIINKLFPFELIFHYLQRITVPY